MNEAFRKRQMLFLAQLLAIATILYLLHSYLLNALQPDKITIIPLWTIYVFHAIAVCAVYSVINFRFSNGKHQVFNAFILLMVLKMVFVVVFLLPIFFSAATDKIIDVVHFFIPYFIFLAFEVYSIYRFLSPI